MEPLTTVVIAGFAIGMAFGAIGQRTGFCLMRGLLYWWTEGDRRRIGMFALALAAAIAGSQALWSFGLVDLGKSLYLQTPASWLLVPLGGVMFGYGMVAANGCGARALVLLGSGNLRSFVVLVCLGLTAYAVLTGVLAPFRLWLASLVSSPMPSLTLSNVLASTGLDGQAARWFVFTLLVAGLLIFALRDPRHRPTWIDGIGGLVIGALVPLGWLSTGWLGSDPFDPVPLVSLTFVAPIGAALQYLMIATGSKLDFAVATVGGVLVGSVVVALATRTAKLQSFDGPRHMLRLMGGGALMGAGGALALGCSIGQGLTGLSTLAIPSIAAAAGILAGARLALKGPLALTKL